MLAGDGLVPAVLLLGEKRWSECVTRCLTTDLGSTETWPLKLAWQASGAVEEVGTGALDVVDEETPRISPLCVSHFRET